MEKSTLFLLLNMENQLDRYYISSTFLDYPDNSSLSIIIYLSGCSHNCKGCHSPKTQEKVPNYPELENEILIKLEAAFNMYRTNKLVISGGNPLDQHNLWLTKAICNHFNNKFICIYTGDLINDVKREGIKADFIKCGEYMEKYKQVSEKTNTYIQFASSNQELYSYYEGDYHLVSNNGRFLF